MKLNFISKTRLGKWSIGLSIASIVLIGMKIADYFHFPLPTPAIAALGLMGFILSLIAIFKNKDRAILIFLPVLVGLVIILWTTAEFIFPH